MGALVSGRVGRSCTGSPSGHLWLQRVLPLGAMPPGREGLVPCPLLPLAPEGNRNASCLCILSSAASPTLTRPTVLGPPAPLRAHSRGHLLPGPVCSRTDLSESQLLVHFVWKTRTLSSEPSCPCGYTLSIWKQSLRGEDLLFASCTSKIPQTHCKLRTLEWKQLSEAIGPSTPLTWECHCGGHKFYGC